MDLEFLDFVGWENVERVFFRCRKVIHLFEVLNFTNSMNIIHLCKPSQGLKGRNP